MSLASSCGSAYREPVQDEQAEPLYRSKQRRQCQAERGTKGRLPQGAWAGWMDVGNHGDLLSWHTHPAPRRFLQPGSVLWQVLGTPLHRVTVHTPTVTPHFSFRQGLLYNLFLLTFNF